MNSMGHTKDDVKKTKDNARIFVRYKEGAERYGLGRSKFQQMAQEAHATYKVGKAVLINCELFERYLEKFRRTEG